MKSLAPWAPVPRVLAGGVLALSGFLKLMGPAEEFALALESYRLLPPAAVMPAAKLFPWLELLTGSYLAAGFALRFTAPLASALFLVFLGAVGSALARGLNLADCGCFGRGGPLLSPGQVLAMDAFLLACAVAAWWEKEKRWSLDRWLAGKSR